jgi:hypothetical protein
MVGNTLSLATCGPNQIYKTLGTAWSCVADNNTTYSAGTGLDLAGTDFSIDSSIVARKDAAGGNQAFDTNTLFLDYTNNRVGVGTTPAGTFHVSGGFAGADAPGNAIFLTAQAGGADGNADGFGGGGGSILLVAGAAGPASSAGDINLTGASGGVSTTLSSAGEGSDLVFNAGGGGSSSFAARGAGSGGDISMSAGAGGAHSAGGNGGQGGSVTFSAGPATNATGGPVQITAGTTTGTGNGGDISIVAGGAEAGDGGEVTITPGNSSTGVRGSVQLGGIDFSRQLHRVRSDCRPCGSWRR